ncbi:MAG TPA: 2-oxoglutarate dehydrogenase complex dihydrolipoyllysine-residue succinyltransferase [Pirellulales bacterium]|nr:2-oxoglutarate dehydrogenase complex dihydrolipoyllysine-residue succinyltransferase [Pirellulales bacterium]
MTAVELKVPAVGESITEVQIGKWLKDEGQTAEKDENLVEIETDKATVDIVAPVTGTISKVLKRTGEAAVVGETIGYLEPAVAGQAPSSAPRDEEAAAAAQVQAARTIRTAPKPKSEPGRTPSPRKPVEVPPASEIAAAQSTAAPTDRSLTIPPAGRGVAPRTTGMQRSAAPARPAREEEAVPMSPIRRRIAQRLVEAQHSAALLTTFNEIDMSAVTALRNEHKQVFADRYGVKLGFMSFFVKAAIDALKLVPGVNAEIRANDIVYHNYFDIGIAVGGGKGLVVPVLRDADRMNFAEIELAIADLAHRARENSLQLDELQGGTFTISNGGVYGSMLSTPIVNPPQSGILGLHAIQDRPVAREGQVVIRPMMYVALTYDHRVVDGQGAVTFLKRIKEVIEEPMRMLVEI